MNEEEIFHQALARTSPEERAAYLDQACGGDPALRASVEALLRANVGASGFMDKPALKSGATLDEPRVTEYPGTMIGPYKLIEQIGEGGMGTVWMAQQSEPVKRLVAVKLIKAGMDSKQVIARFEAERQALALMDHQNIARVLDAGTTSASRPYFVMDLVRGAPITRYCDEHPLTPRQRLELFIPVCQAVQHAHQKGIIHRDLKPSNVLVALYDGKPVPKVIDFGVAKAAGQSLTDKTLVTGFGAIVGTLEYMSPEQAEINQLDIDTRSDIYSLGVLLYELLTGSPPFSRKELEKAGMLEMLRVIREDEPSKPSMKLSTAEGLAALAVNRGMEPAKLTRLVRGDLDWIVMKALEKDRNRRYETANGFAADVQRYLNDEPVQAYPPSAAYRLRKFVRRHQGPVVAAALVALALVVGIVGMTLGLVEAWRQQGLTEQARQDEAEQRQETKRLLWESEWSLYSSRIDLAQQAWDSNNILLAFHYLESCRPDFRGWEHDYLFTLFYSNQRTYGNQRTVGERLAPIRSVAVSPDGKRIVNGENDGKVNVWDVDTGQRALILRGHTNVVTSVAVSPDGKRIVSGSADQTVKVWDAETGQETRTFRGHTNVVTSVALSPDGKRIVSGSLDGTVIVWDAATGAEALTLDGHPSAKSLAWSPDSKRIVSGLSDGSINVWDADTGKRVRRLQAHISSVTSVALSPDGKRIVSASDDRTIKVWDECRC
jgi:serine/threonine protein kinase/outer membrane protein assembly factor BamB